MTTESPRRPTPETFDSWITALDRRPDEFASVAVDIVRSLRDLLGVSFLANAQPTPGLRLVATSGLNPALYRSFEIPLATPAGRALTSSRTQIVDDVREEPNFRDTALVREHHLRGMVAMPVRVSDSGQTPKAPKPLGVLCLYPRPGTNLQAFAEEFGWISRILGKSYLKCLLLHRLRLRERVVYAANRSRDTGSFLHRALRLMQEDIGFLAGSIYLHEALANTLRMRAVAPKIVTATEPLSAAYYDTTEEVLVPMCFRSIQSITLNDDEAVAAAELAGLAEIWPQDVVSTAVVPIPAASDSLRSGGSECLGAIRIFNPQLRLAGRTETVHVSWPDLWALEFYGEMLGVVTRALRSREEQDLIYEAMFHGAKHLLLSTVSRLHALKRESITFPGRKAYYLEDSIAGLQDIIDQLVRNQLPFMDLVTEPVPLHGDVLAKLPSFISSLSRLKGCDPIYVNNLSDTEIPRLPFVDGDRQALQCVFRNLVDNAIKYVDYEQPHRKIEIIGAVRGSTVVISICDNGIGIPPDEAKRIFNDGFRGRLARNADPTGIGRGLADCVAILEKLGGSVELDLKSSMTKFDVSIPIARP